ncbi:MAG: extracellular solute-binding protein [Fimbriimonas sp.]|nr:extracellular solute-binding protein [Fimbriimonas sp.]
MKSPRILLALACALTALPIQASAQTHKKRDLVIWGISFGPDTKGSEAVVREFSRRHPDVNVRILSMGAGNMNPQKLMTSIVGNVAPDVISQDRFSISDWASRGAFQPLDDWINRDKGKDPLCPRKEQYYPAVWTEASYDGKVYGIPTGADDRILYYNKSIFREKAADLRAAGLDPERAPRTWSELLKYGKVLTEVNKQTGQFKRVGFLPNFGNSWLYMYAFQNNASFMGDRDGIHGRICTMDTPEAEQALQFIVDGYDQIGGYEKAKEFESGFLSNENDPFVLGKVAMKIDGDWILNSLSRYGPATDIGVAPPPIPDDRFYHRGRFANEKETYITWVGGFCYAIPKGARNVQDGWEFIKFATSTEGRMVENSAQKQWEQLKGRAFIPRQQGSMEANEAIFKAFTPADPKFAAALREHIDLMPYGRIRPVTFVGQTLWDNHVKAMESACYHKATPKEALLTAQRVVQRDLDAFFDKSQYPVINLSIPLEIGVVIGLVTLVVFTVIFLRKRMGRLERIEAWWAYLFVSPWMIGFLLLVIGPMIASLFFSFTQYDVLNEARWVGFKNYEDIGGADWLNVAKGLVNAVYLAGLTVPLTLAVGLAIALLLNQATRGMRFYRTFFYMPAIVPGVASAVLWTWVLTPDSNKGLLNAGWQQVVTPLIGVQPPGWVQSADWSKNALVVMSMWAAGSGMILWLAGLKGISSTLYEAASIDGANPRQTFWSITFPQLSPIIFFNAVMGFIGAMQEFDRIYIMKPSSDGPVGPDDSLLTPVYLLFNNGFAYFKMGYSSAIAWMIFGIILLLTYVQFKLAPRWVHYESDK